MIRLFQLHYRYFKINGAFIVLMSLMSVAAMADDEHVQVCEHCSMLYQAEAVAEHYGNTVGLDCEGGNPDPVIGPGPVPCNPPAPKVMSVFHPDSGAVYRFRLEWMDEMPWTMSVTALGPDHRLESDIREAYQHIEGWQEDIEKAEDRIADLIETLNQQGAAPFRSRLQYAIPNPTQHRNPRFGDDEVPEECPSGTALHVLSDRDLRSLVEDEIRGEISRISNDRGSIRIDGASIRIGALGVRFSFPEGPDFEQAFLAYFYHYENYDGSYEVPENGFPDYILYNYSIIDRNAILLDIDYENSRVMGRDNFFVSHDLSDMQTCAIERLKQMRRQYTVVERGGAILTFQNGGFGWT